MIYYYYIIDITSQGKSYTEFTVTNPHSFLCTDEEDEQKGKNRTPWKTQIPKSAVFFFYKPKNRVKKWMKPQTAENTKTEKPQYCFYNPKNRVKKWLKPKNRAPPLIGLHNSSLQQSTDIG